MESMIDVFQLTKSKTRQDILTTFLNNPGRDFYVRELERILGVSAGNVRRELARMVSAGLFALRRQGRTILYRLNSESPILSVVSKQSQAADPQVFAFSWAQAKQPQSLPDEWYCPTRDVFSARLEAHLPRWERELGEDAYLLAAIVGEIGNNSYDHNLGNWPDIAGTFFVCDEAKRSIFVADRGRGVRATIRFVKPTVTTHREALRVAFTEVLSGRHGERRGNGLKFVKKTIEEKQWSLSFYSGDSVAEVTSRTFTIKRHQPYVFGCLVVIRY